MTEISQCEPRDETKKTKERIIPAPEEKRVAGGEERGKAPTVPALLPEEQVNSEF